MFYVACYQQKLTIIMPSVALEKSASAESEPGAFGSLSCVVLSVSKSIRGHEILTATNIFLVLTAKHG